MSQQRAKWFRGILVCLLVLLFILLAALSLWRWDGRGGASMSASTVNKTTAPSLRTRVYRMDTNQFLTNLVYLSGTNAGTNVSIMMRELFVAAGADFATNRPLPFKHTVVQRVPTPFQGLARNLFANLGIDLTTNPPSATQVFFEPQKGLLMVRAQAKDLERVEQAVQLLAPRPNFFDGLDPKVDAELIEYLKTGNPYAWTSPTGHRVAPVTLPEAIETTVFGFENPAGFREQLVRHSRARDGTFAEMQRLMREYFTERGVDFNAPLRQGTKLMVYNDRNGMMLIRTTRAEIRAIERIVVANNYAAFEAHLASRAITNAGAGAK